MRAARLLHILLLLQNRGRMTAPALAVELEVTPRTILRDVDALTEAGLPVITHRGPQGGIELGFNHRTRLTGLATDEAEALAVWLAAPPPDLAALGLAEAAARAKAKLVESLPDRSRAVMAETFARFPRDLPAPRDDPRIAAVAHAIRQGLTLTLRAQSPQPVVLKPTRLGHDATGWSVFGPPLIAAMARQDWGDITLSQRPLP